MHYLCEKCITMELKIGDKVRYLNAIGGGIVAKIINAQLVEVSDESGFNIPFQKTELVKIEEKSFSNLHTASKPIVQAPIKQTEVTRHQLIPSSDNDINGNDMPRIYLAFVQDQENENNIELYLINDCNYHFLYTISSKNEKLAEIVEINTIESNTKEFITSYKKDSMQESKHFIVQGTFFKKKKFIPQQPVFKEITISAVKFFKEGCFKENDFFDEPALIETVYERTLADDIREIDGKTFQKVIFVKEFADKKTAQPSKKENKEVQNYIREVDLHIHELVENERGLTPGDKLEIQIKHFEKELNNAIISNEKRIVFIHGVGNGVLKLKIKSILETKYSRFKFQDASFQKYKFGATLVMI